MKTVDILILLIISLLHSCSSPRQEDEEIGKRIPIVIEEGSRIKFSDVFEQVDYIPLETTDTSLVGIVERFRIFDNKACLICDKSLLMFDANTGRAISKISKLGSAPEEYQSLHDASVCEDGNVELLDMNKRKIRRYDINGNFVSSLELPSMSFSFFANGRNNYWLYNNNMSYEDIKSKVVCYDASKRMVRDLYFPIDTHLAGYFFVVEGNNFAKRQDDLLFFACPSEKIYSLKEGEEPSVAYTIDFGRHAAPQDFYKNDYSDIMEFSTEANKRGYVYFVNNFSANNSYIQLSFFLDKVAYWSIYSENEEKSYTGCILQDDLNSLKGFRVDAQNTLYAINGDYLYFLLSAEQFVGICSNGGTFFEQVNKNNDMNDQSNPLLVRCKFKKNL
ncbi:6-bladed beta-propeller [uncultured Bacteroides sp.]|uniref:6-bladed beta-propeller n=1 Tax=uncultured Bacteroides sp. TaxID=162156 RepID=UPI0025E7C211|nr:6-bladed beta-propeller [uncultured Bacteroides sp.]